MFLLSASHLSPLVIEKYSEKLREKSLYNRTRFSTARIPKWVLLTVKIARCSFFTWTFLASIACNLDDTTDTECLCTEATDARIFAHCSDDNLNSKRNDTSNPFGGRIPDCPTGSLIFLRDATSPEAVLFNLRDTFRGFSPVQYMDQLDSPFLFVPDSDGIELFFEVFQPPDGYNPDLDLDTLWTYSQERRFANSVLNKERFQKIKFLRWYDSSTDERILYEDDPLKETYIFNYEIEFTEQPREGITATVFNIKGRMEVNVVTPSLENPVWIVTRWRDFRDQASAKKSWTELRGEFSQ